MMENESTVLANLIQGLQKDRDLFLKRGLELAGRKPESDTVSDLFIAFAKAQAEFEPVTKNSKGYNYKYCQLDQILNIIRPTLNKHGLSLLQRTDENNVLSTRLCHISGEWIESRIKLPDVEGDGKKAYEQSLGSSLTYMRRYQILALLGVAPENEDDDAASAKRM